jgi:hypothetical protein
MNKSSLIVSVVIALLGIFVGLYFAKNANDELMAYRAEQQDLLLEEQNEIKGKEASAAVTLDTDSIDWLTTLTENTAKAYREYLEQHADGKHVNEAREILLTIASRVEQRAVASSEVSAEKDSVEHVEVSDTIQ